MNQNIDSNKLYQTTSLHQASFLLAKGFQLTGTTRESGRLVFSFTDCPALRSAIDAFHNNSPIENQTFWQAIKTLKGMVYER